MLVVETIARIRREFFVKGRSIKEIVRDLKVSRNTVRKVLRSGETSFSYEREVQPLPRLGRWREDFDRLLAGNEGKAARERLTLIRIFEELRGLGYEGGYDAVRRYARSWRKERVLASVDAFVPLTFEPGEAYQFDWSHEIVLINGTTVTVKVAHLRLCHSRMLFVRAYPRETQEMVFDAHDRAFAFFRGACRRGLYDNMKTAVESVFVGKGRVYNRRFLQMCAHYLVEELRRAQRLAARQVRLLCQGSPPPRGPGPDGLVHVRGRAPQARALCRALRWLPYPTGVRVEDLPRALRQQPLLRDGPCRRPPGRGPGLCRADRHPPGRRGRGGAPALLRTRADHLRSLALRPGAGEEARRLEEWGSVQALGPASCPGAGQAQARRRRGWRSTDGRHPQCRADRRALAGRGRLRGGAAAWRPLGRRRPEHPRPSP